jgi:phospholipase C
VDKGNEALRVAMLRRIFVLMLENRSCDHFLGFSKLRGWDPSVNTDRDLNGVDRNTHFNYLDPRDPVLGKIFVTDPATDSLSHRDKDPGHEFEHTLTDLCGPNNTYSPGGIYPPITNFGFVYKYTAQGSKHPVRVMEVCGPGQVVNLTMLAEHYAVCDRWFSSMPGPTWPNRFFVHAGTSGGLDNSPSTLATMGAELFQGYEFHKGTIFDRLDTKGIKWVIYEGDSFPQSFAIRGMGTQWKKGRFRDFKYFSDDISRNDFAPQYVFIEPDYGRILMPPWDFRGGNSQHPLDSIASGDALIGRVFDALSRSPHWQESALIITYDEHGGFYDHVAPSTALPTGDDTRYSKNGFTFTQYGVRVPTVIASPLMRKPMVDGTEYDHTSILRTVELLFGLSPLTARDAHANDFLHLFLPPMLLPLRNRLPRLLKEKVTNFLISTGTTTTSVEERVRRSIMQARLVLEMGRLFRFGPGEGEPPGDEPAEDFGDGELDPRMRGFLHIAYLRDLVMSDGLSEEGLIGLREFVMSIRTARMAGEYMQQVRERVEAFKAERQRPGQMNERVME